MLEVKSAVGQVMDSMVYVLSDGMCHDYYLVDIGDYDAVRSLLPMDANVRGVFITHGHHDHILGLNELKIAFPNCIVFASEECSIMLSSAKANLSYYVETPIEYFGEVSILHDGDHVKLYKDIYLDVFATSGHNPSCLSYLVGDYLFTGDSYIPGVKVVTNLPGGNKRMAQESVARILGFGQRKKICPGHKIVE